MAEDKKRCRANTRSGDPCQNFAMDNGRCRMHGGSSPKGNASPNWKNGLYSKYAGSQLKDVLEELENIDSEELVNVDHELKLLKALIIESDALKENTGDLDDLKKISRVIQRLVKSKQRAIALQIEKERLIPARDIQLFLDWMEDLLVNEIGETKAIEVTNQLQNFSISDYET